MLTMRSGIQSWVASQSSTSTSEAGSSSTARYNGAGSRKQQVFQHPGAVVAMDAIGEHRRPDGTDGGAVADAVDQAGAAGTVDPTETDHHRRPTTVRQQLFAGTDATAREASAAAGESSSTHSP